MNDAAEFYAYESWTAGVIGLGYVGLPLAITAENAGLSVIGYDTDEAHIARIRAGDVRVEFLDYDWSLNGR